MGQLPLQTIRSGVKQLGLQLRSPSPQLGTDGTGGTVIHSHPSRVMETIVGSHRQRTTHPLCTRTHAHAHTHTHNLLPNLSGLPMSQVFYYCLKFPDTDKAEQVFKCLINTQQQDNDYSFISVKGHCSQSQKCTGDLSRQEFKCSWCF